MIRKIKPIIKELWLEVWLIAIILMLSGAVIGQCAYERAFFGTDTSKITAAIRVNGKLYPILNLQALKGSNSREIIEFQDNQARIIIRSEQQK